MACLPEMMTQTSGSLGHSSLGTVHWRHLTDIYAGIMLQKMHAAADRGIVREGAWRQYLQISPDRLRCVSRYVNVYY